MIDIDITMPIHIVNVLFLIVIMNIVLYKPIRTILADRARKLANLKNDSETFDKNAELRVEEYDVKIADARKKGKAELDTVRSETQASGAEKVAGIRKEVDADKAAQLGKIHEQFVSAQQELKGQVEGFANEMAAKVLGRAL